MIIRRGRLLPSVIVGALVAGAVTLGAGTASAAEDGDPCYVLLRQGVVEGDKCVTTGGVLIAPLVEAVLGRVPDESPATSSAPSGVVPEVVNGVGGAVGGAVGGIVDGVTGNNGSSTGGTQGGDTAAGSGGSGTGSPSDTATTAGNGTGAPTAGGPATGPAPAAPAALVAPDVRGALAPVATAPGGLLTGVPALSFGRPNVGLLAPLGSPLRTLSGVAPGSPVTTSSDVQAMAFDNMPGGMGTPAVVGVLILSTLGAFALRHRMLRRSRTPGSSER